MPIAGPTKYSFNRGRRFQQARLVKTAIHKKYEQTVEYWINKNKESVKALQSLISSEMNHNLKANKPFALKIDMYFVFEKSKILTKNNKAERLDRDNRIKPLQDQLSKIIGGHQINGSIYPAIPGINTVIYYDGWEVTVGKKTYSYDGVAPG